MTGTKPALCKIWLLRYAVFMASLFATTAKAQADSAALSVTSISDRIFLSPADLRKNKFILKEDIITSEDKEQVDFLSKALATGGLVYRCEEGQGAVLADSVWAFFQNNAFYVNYKNQFCRVPVFGSLCYFVVVIKDGKVVLDNSRPGVPIILSREPIPNAPVTMAPGLSASTVDGMREYLLNLRDGSVCAFSVKNVEKLIKDEFWLCQSYKELSKRERKRLANSYIMRYNEKRPVYVLK